MLCLNLVYVAVLHVRQEYFVFSVNSNPIFVQFPVCSSLIVSEVFL